MAGFSDYIPHGIMGMMQQDATQIPSQFPFRHKQRGWVGDRIMVKQQANQQQVPQAPSLNDAYSRLAQLLMLGGQSNGGPGPGNWFAQPDFSYMQQQPSQQQSLQQYLPYRVML